MPVQVRQLRPAVQKRVDARSERWRELCQFHGSSRRFWKVDSPGRLLEKYSQRCKLDALPRFDDGTANELFKELFGRFSKLPTVGDNSQIDIVKDVLHASSDYLLSKGLSRTTSEQQNL